MKDAKGKLAPAKEPEPKEPPPRYEPSCWQCDLDIGHVCYHGINRGKWGAES